MRLSEWIPNALRYRGSFVGGTWMDVGSHAHGSIPVQSPADLDCRLPDVSFSYDHVDISVGSAAQAFSSWRDLPLADRIHYLGRLRQELEKSQAQLAQVISIETGKPHDEAKGEAAALLSKIDVTIEHGLKLVETQRLQFEDGSRGEIHWRPKGVLVVIGPFNFPVHLNHGHIVPALLMGNCIVLKPSEKTPYSAQIYAEAFERASFPPGVFNLIQGDGVLASKLIRHVKINGVLATCSYEIGCQIQKDLAEKPRKIVALEMGGKNAAIVWDGIDIDKVANDLVRSSFLTTGQRCTALSRLYVKRSVLESLMAAVHERAKALVIHHPFSDNPKPYMGPLITQKSVDNFFHFSKMGEHEGKSIMRPKLLEKRVPFSDQPLPRGYYVTPSINYVPQWSAKSVYQTHEIFGPDLFFCPVDELEDAVNAVNSNYYGLSFSLFGADEKTFDWVADHINSGVTYWNRPTVGASGRLPFGGWGRSGNHRPAGLFAIYASTQVQSRAK